MNEISLDRIDKKILRQLQQDNKVSNIELAEIVSISPPTCSRRVQRLRDLGIIKQDVSILDAHKVANQITLVINLELREEDRANMKQLEEVFVSCSIVTQFYLVTGQVDYIVILSVPNMSHFEKFADEYLYENPMIKRFQTQTVIKCFKFTTELPSLEAI